MRKRWYNCWLFHAWPKVFNSTPLMNGVFPAGTIWKGNCLHCGKERKIIENT